MYSLTNRISSLSSDTAGAFRRTAIVQKPTWNYWTQIRDSKDNNRLELTMLNKTEGNKPIASLQIDLLPYKCVNWSGAVGHARARLGAVPTLAPIHARLTTIGTRFRTFRQHFLIRYPSSLAHPVGNVVLSLHDAAGTPPPAERTRTAGTTFGTPRCATPQHCGQLSSGRS